MDIQLFQGLKTDLSHFGVRSLGSKILGNHHASKSSLAHIPKQDFSANPLHSQAIQALMEGNILKACACR